MTNDKIKLKSKRTWTRIIDPTISSRLRAPAHKLAIQHDHTFSSSRYSHMMPSQADSLELPLNVKVAIVTGASRGIGAGLALELARNGAKVLLSRPNHVHISS
jgi:3-oxoacyl-ACP reductase-like protein